MTELFIDTIHDIKQHGFNWLTALSIILLYRRNRLKKQDRSNINMIMKKLDIPIEERRIFTMPTLNYGTLVPALLGAIKLALNAFGIEFTDDTLNEVCNALGAILALIGIYMSHHKPQLVPVIQEVTQAVKQAPMTYPQAIEIVNDVNQKLTVTYKELQTGRLTDAAKQSIEIYQEIQQLLQKKSG